MCSGGDIKYYVLTTRLFNMEKKKKNVQLINETMKIIYPVGAAFTRIRIGYVNALNTHLVVYFVMRVARCY